MKNAIKGLFRCTMLLLVLVTLMGCLRASRSGECPLINPKVEWSPAIQMYIDNEPTQVRCLKVEDYNRVLLWSITMQNMFCK